MQKNGKALVSLCAIAAGAHIAIGCPSSSSPPDSSGGEVAEARRETVSRLLELLPRDARGALVLDVGALLGGSAASPAADLLSGDGGGDPAIGQLLGVVGHVASQVDLAGSMGVAVLVQTTDAEDGFLLLAQMRRDTLEQVTVGPPLTDGGALTEGGHALGVGSHGEHLTMLPGGILVVGELAAVQAVLDVADGRASANASPIAPLLSTLDTDAAMAFIYGLPALLDSSMVPDHTLQTARLITGALDFTDTDVSGSVSLHTPDAASFVQAYNALDAASGEAPLTVAEPGGSGLPQVVVSIPATPINKTGEALVTSRNTLKKLILIMQAHVYAEGVHDPGNPPWVDLIVKSEEDGDGSPGAVFIRWELKDQAAIEAFEAAELPAGFRLAPCRFLESDEPGYFLALNLYSASGGTIVEGTRAEWDVFVQPPDGDQRPRFMVVDALAEAISADPVHGLTPAEPLSHAFVGDLVVTTVAEMHDGEQVPVFSSSFPKPSPATANIARFTREMAIGNDYIYWGHGVYDRAMYNASTINRDALLADLSQVEISDHTRFRQYLADEPTYVIYYTNNLEYVASPWANLDSPYLDITPEWLDELYAFKNGSYRTIMRDAVQGAFRGQKDAMLPFSVENAVPSTYYNFAVVDPEGLSAALDLPAGYSLATTRVFESASSEGHFLTLRVFQIDDAVEGMRAEWSVYVDDGSGRENVMIIALQTERPGVDPVTFISLPSKVRHTRADDEVTTSLASLATRFEARLSLAGDHREALTLDWIEASERVCYRNGICDKLYYDGETLDVPVRVPAPAAVTVTALETPWNGFIDTTPAMVFVRDNRQEYVRKPWHNLKVVVDDPSPDPIADGTHVISGTGTLVGQENHAVDSTYVYTGSALIDGDELFFTIDQEIENALGEGHVISSGSFDLGTGIGSTTVQDCVGPVLLCAGVTPLLGTPEATSEYVTQNLDASDRSNITWDVVFTMTIAGGFGDADSVSSLAATAVEAGR